MTPDDRRIIEDALLRAYQCRPYYRRALAALQPRAWDGLGTIAVGRGWTLYVDVAWFRTHSLDEQAALIAGHEIEHVLRDHASRRGERAAAAWNCACDAAINDDCPDLRLPAGGVTPATLGQPDGRTEEHYYDALPVGAPGVCCGSGAGQPFAGEPADGAGVSCDDAEALRDAVAADVRAHIAAHGVGSVPRGVAVWADARSRVLPIDWRRVLVSRLGRLWREETAGRQDYAWSRPPRRWRADVLRPGMRGYVPRVALVVDTSGSMTDAATGAVVLGTERAIRRVVPACAVVQCDAGVQAHSRCRRRVGEWRGGGGTDLRTGIAAAGKMDIMVVVTDGATPWPDEAPAARVVVVCTTGADVPDWSDVIRVPAPGLAGASG